MVMLSKVFIIVFGFTVEARSTELATPDTTNAQDPMDRLVDNLANRLFNRAFQAPGHHRAVLQSTVRHKSDHQTFHSQVVPSFAGTMSSATGISSSSGLLLCPLPSRTFLSSRAKIARFATKAAPADLMENVKKNVPENSVVVIKYGGHAMENPEAAKFFCEDVAELSRCGISPVIVHGGGPMIKAMLGQLNVTSNFVDGLRVTDAKTMEVVQMVLCGTVNKNIVASISAQPGVRGAVGLGGMDGCLIQATPISDKLGQVGSPTEVNADVLRDILGIKMIPVIAPVGVQKTSIGGTADCTPLNINADTAAGAVAKAVNARALLLMTDITGVLDKDKNLIPKMSSNAFEKFKADGTITGGMIPKLETASEVVNSGVGEVSILDGRERYALLKALSGEDFGTKIVPKDE